MKRINIYIDEQEDKILDYLSEFYGTSRSEIIRRALLEMSDRNKTQIDSFVADLDEPNTLLMVDDVRHFERCYTDMSYFAKQVKILSTDNGYIPLDLYDYQIETLQEMTLRKRIVILKSRQIGMSTMASLHILHTAIFTPNQTIVIMAPKQDQAIYILDIIASMMDTLNLSPKPKFTTRNRTTLTLDSGSTIIASHLNGESVRGRTINYCYVDEASFVNRTTWDEFSNSVLPTVVSSNNSKLIIASNPNGANHFYKTYVDALTHYSNAHHIELPWNIQPNRDDLWKQQMIARIGLLKFESEFNCKFISEVGGNHGI